jgi:hypothetical protein
MVATTVPLVTAVLTNHEITIPAAQRSRPKGEIAMKTITSALVVLLVIAGVAGSASAFDAKDFYEQVDRNHN